MRRILVAGLLSCFLAAVVWCAPGSVSMPSLWRYAHPEAKALIGIEWSRILNSPLGQQMRQKITESGMSEMEGLDFLDDIDRVFISSPGNPEGETEQQPPVVIAARGRFDLAKVREIAAAKMTAVSSYQSIEILEQHEAGNVSMAMALVDSRTILLGDSESVMAAIDYHLAADPGMASNPLFLRAVELAAGNDLWIVAHASPSDFSKATTDQAPFLKDVERIEAGLSFQDGLGLQLNLGTASEDSAQTLAGGLQFMLAMLLSGQQNQPGMPNFSEKLRVSTDGSMVRLAFSLDQSELEQAFNQVESSVASSLGGAGDVEVRAAVRGDGEWNMGSQPHEMAVSPPVVPENQVIRIYGLENGPREIPFGK